MTIGDRVKLHMNLGYAEALELSGGIGIVADLDLSPTEDFVLIHFDDMAVYISPVKEGEVEVVPSQ